MAMRYSRKILALWANYELSEEEVQAAAEGRSEQVLKPKATEA